MSRHRSVWVCLVELVVVILLIAVQIQSSSSHINKLFKRVTKEKFDCPVEIKNCIEPITSKVCSGQGACVCGQCACFQTEFDKYYGRFCEHCETCSPNMCEYLKPCVECRVHASGQYEKLQDCDTHCSRFPEIQIAEVTSSDEKDGHYFCSFKDGDDCEFYFVYGYDAVGHLIIIAERDKECPLKSIETSKTSFDLNQEEQILRQRQQQQRQQQQHSSPFKRPPPVIITEPHSSPPEDQTKNHTSQKILNTQAFDLMIVCGLTMTRQSDRTTQLPNYLQRTGIHFDLQNCQFIPRSQAFVLTSQLPQQQQHQGLSRSHRLTFSVPTFILYLLLLLH